MEHRPIYKHENFSDEPGNAYEMKPLGGETYISPNVNDSLAWTASEEYADKQGTFEDRKDMYRMNKAQELRRNFRFMSMVGYSVLLGDAWVLAIIGAIIPLTNGGTAGGVWIFLIVIIGMSFSTTSMAEMANHWVSEFAPKQYQRFLSYMTGWLCVLGWQMALCATAYSAALAVQGMIALNDATYTVPRWQGVLLTIGIVLSTIVFNTVLIRKLPALENIMLVIYLIGFIAVLTVMWVMGDKAPARETFLHFSDLQDWGSVVVAMLVGSLAASSALLGADSSAHLAEELKEASWVLPRSMVTTAAINYTLTWIIVITYMTVKGGTVDELLATNYAQPYVQIFYNVTQSTVGATALTALMFALLLFGIINQVTTTSRQLFAFARDRGLPFSSFLSKVRPGWDIPLNAVTVTLCFSIVVSMIILGSPVAFFTLSSLCNSALFASYIICIGCITWRRLAGEPLLPSRFDLGKAGIFVNLAALSYLCVQFVFIFFPTAPDPTAPTFNWTILVFGLVIVWALAYYHIWGKHDYKGPVT